MHQSSEITNMSTRKYEHAKFAFAHVHFCSLT